jgi:hypothetical protein
MSVQRLYFLAMLTARRIKGAILKSILSKAARNIFQFGVVKPKPPKFLRMTLIRHQPDAICVY